jgi:hypothetical protein
VLGGILTKWAHKAQANTSAAPASAAVVATPRTQCQLREVFASAARSGRHSRHGKEKEGVRRECGSKGEDCMPCPRRDRT